MQLQTQKIYARKYGPIYAWSANDHLSHIVLAHRVDVQMLVPVRKILADFKTDLADYDCTDAAYLQ